MRTFKDLFSTKSSEYAAFRPSYPIALFRCLSDLCHEHHRAWDCATGNGQAALMLADFFDEVIASDLSHNQIEQAKPHHKVKYIVATAEHSTLPNHSVDLVTVAQAFHWFNKNDFIKELQRVVKPGAIVAIWCYGLARITKDIDSIIEHFYFDILGSYWEPERKLVEVNYDDVVLPFEVVPSSTFIMTADWTVDHLLGYLNTWSAVKKFTNETKKNPVEFIREQLIDCFKNVDTHRVTWKLDPKIWRCNNTD